ncbi:MAG: hypothetical protein RL154_1330 [Pseudomonadota bacterium]|jgi:MerR family transcriptional regulator/heat shock protein HspR
MHSFEEPVYTIGVVSAMLGIHPQTLRHYEKEGLLNPFRTAGNTRFYSQKNIDDLHLILRLTKELGVNLAGIDIILQLRHQIEVANLEIKTLQETLAKQGTKVAKNRQVIVKRSQYHVVVVEGS